MSDEMKPRDRGCECHREEGDSDCPVHNEPQSEAEVFGENFAKMVAIQAIGAPEQVSASDLEARIDEALAFLGAHAPNLGPMGPLVVDGVSDILRGES